MRNSHGVCFSMPNSPFIKMTRPKAIAVAEIEPISGQALGLTR